LWKRRAGAYVIDNALRTLDAPRQRRDFAESLVANARFAIGEMEVNVGDVAAQVWAAIERHGDESEREMLRESFVIAMNDCIEDEGYRVCNNGVVQRLLQVLQGYVPGVWLDYQTPQKRVCDVAEEFSRKPGTPHAGDVARWKVKCIAEAEEVYGRGSSDHAVFIRHLQGYIDYTF